MRNYVLSLLFCAILGGGILLLCKALGGSSAVAEWLALTPAIFFIPLNEFLDRYVDHRESPLSYLKSYDHNKHFYDWRLSLLYSLFSFIAAMFTCGLVSGFLGGSIFAGGYAAELYVGVTVSVISIIISTVITVWIGLWIGGRTRRFGMFIAVFVTIFGPLVLRISEVSELDDTTFALMHPHLHRDFHFFLMSTLFNLPQIGIPMTIGYAVGNRDRYANYTRRIAQLTPNTLRPLLARDVKDLAVQLSEFRAEAR